MAKHKAEEIAEIINFYERRGWDWRVVVNRLIGNGNSDVYRQTLWLLNYLREREK